MVNQLVREAALADPGLADHHDEAPVPGERILEPCTELGELGFAAHKDSPSCVRPDFGRRFGCRCPVELGLLPEDRLVELA
jgi:hypothetical protein